jgi:hypothetical protein
VNLGWCQRVGPGWQTDSRATKNQKARAKPSRQTCQDDISHSAGEARSGGRPRCRTLPVGSVPGLLVTQDRDPAFSTQQGLGEYADSAPDGRLGLGLIPRWAMEAKVSPADLGTSAQGSARPSRGRPRRTPVARPALALMSRTAASRVALKLLTPLARCLGS